MTTLTADQARAQGYTFVWEDNFESVNHVQEFDGYDSEPETCEVVRLLNTTGELVAILGCIDDATDEHRADVENDLAAEIPEPDTYATSLIDGLRTGDTLKVQIYSDGTENGRDFSDKTKWFNISTEELAAIRAILARRTVQS